MGLATSIGEASTAVVIRRRRGTASTVSTTGRDPVARSYLPDRVPSGDHPLNLRVRRLTVVLWLTIGTLPAFAHPGHGDGGSGPKHYLTEPVHAVAWWGTVAVASGAVLGWAFRPGRPRSGDGSPRS